MQLRYYNLTDTLHDLNKEVREKIVKEKQSQFVKNESYVGIHKAVKSKKEPENQLYVRF